MTGKTSIIGSGRAARGIGACNASSATVPCDNTGLQLSTRTSERPPTRTPLRGKQARARTGQDPDLLRRLLRAKDRIDAASHEDWPVRRLARVSCVSQAHFARSFAEAFGVPPHRYLLTRRIERATALLRDTDQPITEIAFQTGWKSLGAFGRTFRDITGASPGDQRAQQKATLHELERVPACFVSAAQRPALTIAVSEKRRRDGRGTKDQSEEAEVP
jgi:AraC-like DNA-binding protein